MKINCNVDPCIGCPLSFLDSEFQQSAVEVVSQVVASHGAETSMSEDIALQRIAAWVTEAPDASELKRAADLKKNYQAIALSTATIHKIVTAQCISENF